MKRRALSTIGFILSCLLLFAFPAYAGEWQQEGEDEWRYIQDDGTAAVGRTEIDDAYFFFDEDGYRQNECWKKSSGSWYYYGEDGEMETSTWVDNYYVDRLGRMTKTR